MTGGGPRMLRAGGAGLTRLSYRTRFYGLEAPAAASNRFARFESMISLFAITTKAALRI